MNYLFDITISRVETLNAVLNYDLMMQYDPASVFATVKLLHKCFFITVQLFNRTSYCDTSKFLFRKFNKYLNLDLVL